MQSYILRKLAPSDLAAIEPWLATRDLPRGTVIELPGSPISHAHFIESGFVSVLLKVGRYTSEVGLVGREGMLGVPAVLGAPVSTYSAIVREDVRTSQVPVDKLRNLISERHSIGSIVLR